jgi:hypothetical protein
MTSETTETKQTPRAIRLDARRAEAKTVRDLLSRIAQLDAELDVVALIALIDVFELGEHCESTENWLGTFLHEVLMDVAGEGAQVIGDNPEWVQENLDKALEHLRDDLERARDFVKRHPKIVSELPVTAVGGGSEVEPCQ